MEKAQKVAVVEDLSGIFRSASVVVVSHYVGMTVAEMTALRGRMLVALHDYPQARLALAAALSEGDGALAA